jgi:hypothetical protein
MKIYRAGIFESRGTRTDPSGKEFEDSAILDHNVVLLEDLIQQGMKNPDIKLVAVLRSAGVWGREHDQRSRG